MKKFIKNLIDTLSLKKVDYGDIRVVETEIETITLKNGVVEAILHDTDLGFGIRVLKNSAWGFSSANQLTRKAGNKVIKEALDIARASARIKGSGVNLTPLKPQKGTYRTQFKIDPMKISLDQKLELLLTCNSIMRREKLIKVSQGFLRFKRIKVYFASTEGSLVSQDFVYSGGGIKVYAVDKEEMQSRSYGDFSQQGYEFIKELNFIKNAPRIAEEVVMLLKAEPCPEKKATVVLDSDQMVLQVHESCGHPAELDRVLGTEASYAGTSFLTPDKLNKFKYGSEIVNIVADATVPKALGTFGWDDEGVPARKVYLVKNGLFVGYLTSRETAGILNQTSSGAMRADGWNRIPLIRMTNINLLPGTWKFEEIIQDTKDGIFMQTNKSWSIDDKRLNFQFGCEFARAIKNGRLTKVYKNATYAGITPRFWKSCDAIANRRSWKVHGVPNCGKGEPGQSMFVGHGTAPARFRNIQIGIAR